jgi:hypothetical protein
MILFGQKLTVLKSPARHFLEVAICTQRCGNDLVHVWPVGEAGEPFSIDQGVGRHTTGTRPLEPVPECQAGSSHCYHGPPPTPNNNSRHTASVGHRRNPLFQGINAAFTGVPLDTVPVGPRDHLMDIVQRQHWQCLNEMATDRTDSPIYSNPILEPPYTHENGSGHTNNQTNYQKCTLKYDQARGRTKVTYSYDALEAL